MRRIHFLIGTTPAPAMNHYQRRGLACRDLDDCPAMTFAVDIAFRSQQSQLVYQFPLPNAWMGY
jgi:hypothetical protein